MRDATYIFNVKRWDFLKWIVNAISFAFYSRNALDFSASLCLANTIQHGSFSTFIANHIIKNKMISVEDCSLVHRIGEHVMDKILTTNRFTEEAKLLLLIAWFDKCIEQVLSPATFEEAVGRLIDHIDCTNFEGSFLALALCNEDSNFSNNRMCRWAKPILLIPKFKLVLKLLIKKQG